jgi:hypothetical protein
MKDNSNNLRRLRLIFQWIADLERDETVQTKYYNKTYLGFNESVQSEDFDLLVKSTNAALKQLGLNKKITWGAVGGGTIILK